jgi:hypothetical protein
MIAARNRDGSFTSIYCHWDGYPAHVGLVLRDHYATEAKVRALLALGDLSSLGPELGERHPFDDRTHPAWTTAYGRDRGEAGCEARTSPDVDALRQATQDCGGEWLYVWTGHGWQAAEGGIAFFGMPADKLPEGLESVDYWIQRHAKG